MADITEENKDKDGEIENNQVEEAPVLNVEEGLSQIYK